MKRLIKGILILMGFLVLAACGGSNENNSLAEARDSVIPWRQAYKDALRNYYENIQTPEEWLDWSFFLHDIDLDEVPELFIVYIAAGIWSKAVYSFRDGEITPILGDFFAYFGIFAPLEGPGIIIQAYGLTRLMVLEDDELVVKTAFRRPFLPGDERRWFINEIEVSEAEFYEAYNAIMPPDDGAANIWPDVIDFTYGTMPF
jgi:hypothetical protein